MGDAIQALRPLPLLSNPHLQTILAAKLRLPLETPSVTRYVPLADGDSLALEISTPGGWRPQDGTVILLHGLCGCHGSPYMQRIARKLWHRGVRAVRMNMRGCGSGHGLARQPYHSGRSADVLAVLEALQQTASAVPAILIGFSLGGNVALKLAGELGGAAAGYLQQVIAVCPPVDLLACMRQLEQPQNRFYNRYFTWQLQRAVDARHACFADLAPVTWPPGLTIYQFDNFYTAPQCGFRDAIDYYQKSSAVPVIPTISIPCHILFALDDPIIDPTVLNHILLPPHIRVVCAPYGGHLGFLGRPWHTSGYRALDTQILAWVQASWPTSRIDRSAIDAL